MINKTTIAIIITLLVLSTLTLVVLAGDKPINYTVKPGDNLYQLAQQYGTSIDVIKSMNQLSGDNIYVDERLSIPRGSQPGAGMSFVWPVKGRISSGYGYRTHPLTGEREFHGGIDIAVPTGTRVKAAAAGKIVWSGWVQGFGNTIVMDHGKGYKTLYGHNSRLLVTSGTWVDQSQVIALSGSTGNSTGPHVDFRIYLNGETVNPRDYLA